MRASDPRKSERKSPLAAHCKRALHGLLLAWALCVPAAALGADPPNAVDRAIEHMQAGFAGATYREDGWENHFKQAINVLRDSSDYHRRRFYVVDAMIHSYYGMALLQRAESKEEVRRGAEINRSAITVLYDGLNEHRRVEEEIAQSKEAFINFALAATGAINQYMHASRGIPQVFTPPSWIDVPPDFSALPEVTSFEGNLDSDVTRFPAIPIAAFLRAIGRISSPQSYCTGALVAPRLVLTNAHCANSARPDPEFFLLERLTETLKHRVITYYTHEGERGGWSDRSEDDWAILVLAEPVDEKPLAVKPRITGAYAKQLQGNLAIAGYSGDLNNGLFLTVDWGCSITHLDAEILEGNCRSWKGSSGSPVVDLRSGTVIALHAYGKRSSESERCVDQELCIGGGPTLSKVGPLILRLAQKYR